MAWDMYTWIFALGTVFSFIAAFGIGANDVANSFASSVGAKALTMGQAIVVAAICEFTGAMLLGASVTDTIKNKIANTSYYTATPELLMYGFLAVLIAAAFWDNMACHLELPVSTTHTIVGATVGMSMAIRGGHSVVWSKHKVTFPYIDGMLPIFLSWVISPVTAGILAIIMFGLIRTFVLRSKQSFIRAICILPFLLGLTFFVITVFIIQTGAKNGKWATLKDPKVFGYSIAVGGGMGILGVVAAFFIRKSILADEEIYQQRRQQIMEQGMAAGIIPKEGLEKTTILAENRKPVPGPMPTKEAEEAYMRDMAELDAINREGYVDRLFNNAGAFWHNRVLSTRVGGWIFNNPVTRTIGYGSQYKVHDVLEEQGTNYNKTVANMWATAEVFDPNTERVFRYLQVFSACVMSFAHGSNDVANAVGPYSAMYTIWTTGKVPSKSNVETWILAMGGAGIVLGLATFGYKIMRVLGVKSVKVTNARGFCMELATASTVILASRYGLPISTTQVITGAVLGVGIFEGAKGVNWRVFARIFTGWVFTLVIASFVSAAIAAWGVYSPSKICADDSVTVIKALDSQTLRMIRELNTTSGVGATVTSQLKGFNNTLTTFYKNSYNSPPAVSRLNMQVFSLYNSSICQA